MFGDGVGKGMLFVAKSADRTRLSRDPAGERTSDPTCPAFRSALRCQSIKLGNGLPPLSPGNLLLCDLGPAELASPVSTSLALPALPRNKNGDFSPPRSKYMALYTIRPGPCSWPIYETELSMPRPEPGSVYEMELCIPEVGPENWRSQSELPPTD